MPWFLILRSPWTWVVLAFIAVSGYAAVQHLGWKSCSANFAQFRADTQRLGNEAKVRNAQEVAQQAQHAQEALNDLQARNTALSASYERLRHSRSGGRPVSRLSDAAPSLSACPGKPEQPDSASGRMDQVEGAVNQVLEFGDKEIAKFVGLWQLQQRNAKGTSVSSETAPVPKTNATP